MSKKKSFYEKKVSQSEYRGANKARSSDTKETRQLDVALNELVLNKDQLKAELRNKIRFEMDRVIEKWLPEERHSAVRKEPFLVKLYKTLGI